ncbi:FtsW/RodA/SpoVE family cell cycle protein [Thermorudis peleae]|uniref:FtsW/RodA/SpoVE family cell cycle protein n=1 Tax=Thermorudis peleae TaxID=1382356 RepID=UPI000570C9BE|nr:FtsW/RodA/SpoVE family cell cycle protein [Thermorudis peleae]
MSQALTRIRLLELQLLVLPGLLTVVGLLTIFLARSGTTTWHWSDIAISVFYMGLVLATSIWLSLIGFRGDQVLLPIVATLTGLGLLLIQRLQPALAARGKGWATIAQRQVIYITAGFAVLWLIIAFVRRLDWLRRYKYTLATIGIALMLATMLFGQEIGGAKLWLRFGTITVQPSELTKLLLVIFLAAYLDEYRDLIASGYRWGPITIPPLPYLLPMSIMWGLSILMVILQNDLGIALLFFSIFLVMLYVATGRLGYVLAGAVAFAIAAYVALHLVGHARVRVAVWLNPWSDPQGTGFQLIQAEYAFAHGHIFGTGLGFGMPQAIPVVETDYSFAAFGEELGLLGTVAILALYLLLVARGALIAFQARDTFLRLLAAGLSAVLGLQAFIILAGDVRLLPLTGITLPFISAGGSSLLTNFLIVGLLLKISAHGEPA